MLIQWTLTAALLAVAAASSVRRVTAQLKQLTVQVPGYSPTEDDEYISVAIKAEPGYIVKFEPFASADRVHHMLLYGCDRPAEETQIWRGGATCAGASHILYAWARNAPSLTLPENVGFAVGASTDSVQYIVLQVHYAHPFQGKVRDFSGVIMHLTDVRPQNLAAVYLFVSGEPIPPRMDASYNNVSCTYDGDAELHPFAFRTHTHAMGRVVSAYFRDSAQKWQQIGKRNPQWPQLFQKSPTGLVIRKGDFMAATCRFDSHDKSDYTPMGSMGVNEMCNFYMMFYRDAASPDPFPYGGGCGYNEKPKVVADEYPTDGTTMLPAHPEWEHAAHQGMKPFGVLEKHRITKIGDQRLGQVAGAAFDHKGDLFVFHRAERTWDGNTFDANNQLTDRSPIAAPTVLHATADPKSGYKLVEALGGGEFYLPHGIFVDGSGYVYTTDVGSHQVIKWKIKGGKLEKVWELGEKFVPGSDRDHFCKPAGVAVSRVDGSVYIADGYCNARVMHFSKDGRFLAEFGHASPAGREGASSRPPLGSFFLPHDVSIDERSHQVFVADRENGRVQIFNEQGDALDEIYAPSLFANIYSAHFCPMHGLVFIPGLQSTQNKIEAYVSSLNGTTKIQYSFAPKSADFTRPHIIRQHHNQIIVGEIDERGGVLWVFEVEESSETVHLPSEALYAVDGNAGASAGAAGGDYGSSVLITALVLASIAVAAFVAFMRYRDVAESNGIVDRTGFRPLRTTEAEEDESDEEDLSIGIPKPTATSAIP